MLEIKSSLSKKQIMLFNQIAKKDPDYAQTGTKGYASHVIRQFIAQKDNSIPNLIVKYSQAYYDLLDSDQFKDVEQTYDDGVKTVFQLNENSVMPHSQDLLDDINESLLANSFWNLSRVVDYALVKNFTGQYTDFALPNDPDVSHVLKNAQFNSWLKKMAKDPEYTDFLKHEFNLEGGMFNDSNN